MAEFYIYDYNRVRLGQLQHDDSIQWLDNYQKPGEVKITAQATQQNIELLVEDNRVYNTDEDTVGVIVDVDIIENETSHVVVARAQLTAQLLDERVVMATESVRNVESAMYSIYSKNCRNLPINLAAAKGLAETAETEITWNSVLDAEKTLAEISGLGFTVKFNPETTAETFTVYKGTDRSKEGTPDYVGYFGTDSGNIKDIEINRGKSNYKNVAIVAGEGEGAARTVRTVALGNFTGENRRELYVDARDLQRETSVAVDTGQKDSKGNPIFEYRQKTYTEAEYNAMLDARGLEKLGERLIDFGLRCDIEQSNLVYGVDYFLGDRIPVKLPEYGLPKMTAIVASINRVYDEDGEHVVATLDNFEKEE